MRVTCHRCHKPARTCICDRVPRVNNRTGIWILQHKRERHHPIGTARIAELGLERVRLDVCYEVPQAPPMDVPPGTGLLYPGPGARPLRALAPGERPSTLVVLDGTWHHAHVMHRDARWLRRLPCYAFEPEAPSRYRIRREPARDFVSTIEAVVEALQILEPETAGLEELLGAFEAMIDDQIRLAAASEAAPRRHRRARDHGRVPRALAGPFERLVVIYGESAASPCASPGARRELVQWTALRPATGEIFDRLHRLPADRRPPPRHLRHMGLDPESLDGGGRREDLAEAFEAFCRPNDVLVAWNKSSLDLLAEVAPSREALPLKATYGAVRAGRAGTLDDVLAREGLRARPVAVRGRASRRLGNAVAVLDWLRRRALDRAA